LAVALLTVGLTVPQLFLVTGLMNAAVAFYIYGLVPEFLLRFACWALIHTVYRLEKIGTEQIPETGPALLVCNHVSYVDVMVISASCPRPIRFIVDERFLRKPGLRYLLRDFRAIPVQATASGVIQEALQKGELVCCFPEVEITDSGTLGPFRVDIKKVLGETDVSVIPMALKGLWGSVFSKRHGPFPKSLFRMRLFLPIKLNVGEPFAARDITTKRLQIEIAELGGEG